METIKISEKKLKIMCTEDDLERYELSVPVDVATAPGRQRLRRLLHDACGELDFDPSAGRVFVQIYESAAGGCELFVTQYDKFRCEGDAMKPGMISKPRSERGIYAFPDFNSLLAVCGRLARPGRAGSAAYAGHSGGYYLLTYESAAGTDAICGEYGGERCGDTAAAFLAEHCDCICQVDAVGVLGALL